MDAFQRTTKQIAAKYKENLTYWHRPHYLRTMKLTLFLIAVVIGGAFVFGRYKATLFSTGPISANHSSFQDRCEKCHVGADPSLLNIFRGENNEGRPAAPSEPDFSGGPKPFLTRIGLGSLQKSIDRTVETSTSLQKLDQACATCHEPYKYHQPQLLQLGLQNVRTQITGAKIDACSSCHREHEGPAKMPPPPSTNCVSCHSNAGILEQTLVTFQTGSKFKVPPTGTVVDFRNDNTRRFVPPRPLPDRPYPFTGFETGHPQFGYEQPGMQDPAKIRFNHLRHMQSDVIRGNGAKVQCIECHRPGADGVFMERITYDRDCSACHSLHFSPAAPELRIPHHDAEKVYDEMTSPGLTVLFMDYAVRYRGATNPQDQGKEVQAQFDKLKSMGLGSIDALRVSVFRNGYPPNVTKNQAFPACAKCHFMDWKDIKAIPHIIPTNMADRWLTRGPFNHNPHLYMACTDCHDKAMTSNKTEDILLPSKNKCAECHRPLAHTTEVPVVQRAETTKLDPERTAKQLKEGGVRSDCQFCHPRYHATPDATVFAKSHTLIPNPHK